ARGGARRGGDGARCGRRGGRWYGAGKRARLRATLRREPLYAGDERHRRRSRASGARAARARGPGRNRKGERPWERRRSREARLPATRLRHHSRFRVVAVWAMTRTVDTPAERADAG